MMKMVRTALVLLLLLVTSGIDAQKIDQRLTRLVEQTVQRRAQGLKPIDGRDVNKTIAVNYDKDGTITTLSAIATLKEGAECPREKLEQMGIKVRFVLGDMVALVIPVDKLMALEDVEELKVVEADEMRSLHNDLARVETGVENVNTPAAAELQKLPKAYTGEGVVLGIIDSGIDYNHAAFKDANGNTRVKLLLDYSTNEIVRYTSDEEIKKLTVDTKVGSHGTHTSASAGGSATDNGMQGMAPQADLVLCGLGDNLNTTKIIECMKAIFKYADEVHKPAVVSISLGQILGLHDGSDYVAKAVAELTSNGTKEGRAVVMSSGNDARNYQSIVSKLPTEDIINGYKLMTVLGAAKYPTETNPDQKVTYNANYLCYINGDYNKNDFIGFSLVNLKTGEIVSINGHVRTVKDDKVIEDKDFGGWETKETIAGSKKYVFSLNFASTPVYLDDSNLRLALYAKGNPGNTIVMLCNGQSYKEPCFDAPQYEGYYDFAQAGYTKGSGDMTSGADVCNDYVISVGSYITRTKWNTYDNQSCSYNPSTLTKIKQVIGEISDYSSYCIADDNGKQRPMVLSPGQGIISAASNYDTAFFLEGQPGVVDTSTEHLTLCGNVEKFGRNNWYILSQGTSMSTPIAAGIVTLWMQANPKLTVNEIKSILQSTGKWDEWTTIPEKIPSKQFQQSGLYGKIDCLAGLKKITETTAIETISADGLREATPASMYNVDAPVYNMMGQRVDKSQKGLVIYKGRKYLNR